MKLNINTDEAVKFTNKLEKLHKSALPVAVRETLNEAAFDLKKNEMLKKAKSAFIERQQNFFKANSKVEKALGFNINAMKATVGFFENTLKGNNNYAVKDLEQQEHGGRIDGKSFIPTIFSRVGNSNKGKIRPNARLQRIREKGIVDSKHLTGRVASIVNDRQRYTIAAKRAGIGGFIIHKKILWKINKIIGFGKIDATPFYSVSKGRKINATRTGFMKLASLETTKKMEGYYIGKAQKQINRLVKRT